MRMQKVIFFYLFLFVVKSNCKRYAALACTGSQSSILQPTAPGHLKHMSVLWHVAADFYMLKWKKYSSSSISGGQRPRKLLRKRSAEFKNNWKKSLPAVIFHCGCLA